MDTQRINVGGVFLEAAFIAAPAGACVDRAPLVFLHEGLGSVAMWRDWPASLCAATGRTGVVYSRRGYGKSSPIADVRAPAYGLPDGQRGGRLRPDYHSHEALRVLPELLARLGLRRPVLVGHSDGATIALIHAAVHPVAACVVLAPHLMVEEICLHALEQARRSFETTDWPQRLARYHDDAQGAFWQWNDIWLDPAFRNFDIRSQVRAITAPLLAIQGANDEYASMAQLDELAAAAPQARLLKLADCGHSPQRDQPQAVNTAIARFLDTV